MKYRQIAVLEALRSAQRFLDANAALLTGVELAAARMRLDEVIVKLSEYALNQVASDRHARQETARQCELSHKLRVELLQPIAVIARHCLREVPQFKALQLPKARVPRSEFIARARRMLAAAAIHKGTFQAYGLPSSFLDDIEVALAKLESSANDRRYSRSQRAGATLGLTVEERKGQTVLRVLDALIEKVSHDNEQLLRAWKEARRVARRSANTTSPAAAG